MWVTRRDRFSAAPITTAGGVRSAGARRPQGAAAAESSFDQITLSARPGEESGSFRALVSDLSRPVRTVNTTGKIQELRRQVASGQYRPDARETAARMLLMAEGE